MISFSQKTFQVFRQAGLTVAFAIGLCAASSSSFAYSAEAQQMCTGDAFRLCSSAIPNVSAVTAHAQAARELERWLQVGNG
jgi:hypothetical protein